MATVRLLGVFVVALAILAVAYFAVGGFASIVLALVGLAVFWLGFRYYAVPRKAVSLSRFANLSY